MPTSWASEIEARCPKCGHSFNAEVWVIIDGRERPDLIRRIEAGTLNRITCDCGFTEIARTPLVLELGREGIPLLVFPQEGLPDGELDEVTKGLIVRYFRNLGLEPNQALVNRGWTTPSREFLPGIVKGIYYQTVSNLSHAG